MRGSHMRPIGSLVTCVLCILVSWGTPALAQEGKLIDVTLSLKWFHQFQFSGYYAALEQGFYAEEGLNVLIKERDPKTTTVKEVVEGRAEFGVSDSSLIVARMSGQPVVLISQIFQHSPMVLISLAENNIRSPADLIGKRVMYQQDVDDALIVAMLNEQGVEENQIEQVPHNFDNWALLGGHVDAMSAYITNQPYLYREQGYSLNIINPANYGIDFYGDNLFTSEATAKNNPELVQAFQRASLKGWLYALENPEKVVSLILTKYPNRSPKTETSLLYEAHITSNMIQPNLIEIGHVNKSRFARIANVYRQRDRIPKSAKIQGFFFDEYLIEDKKFLYVREFLVSIFVAFVLIVALVVVNRRLKQVVIEKTRSLIAAKEVAEESARAKGEFLANMSHEIRTPMTGIIGILSQMSRGELSPRQQSQVQLAQRSANALHALLNDILDVSKIDAGKLELEYTSFDLSELVSEVALSNAYSAHQKQINFVLKFATKPGQSYQGDPGRIRQVLNNLISNAIKFTDFGKVILEVATITEGGQQRVVFVVEDNGVGIPEDKLKHIFTAFSQVDSSVTRKYGGTGLGLSIVQQLCSLMNGHITVESRLDIGSKFTVTLPLEASPESRLAIRDGRNLEVAIVVDADADSNEAIAQQLKRRGLQVFSFSECNEALSDEFLKSALKSLSKPTVLFIDGLLPLDSIQLLRTHIIVSTRQEVKLFAMHPVGYAAEPLEMGELSGVFTLNKPVTPLELSAALRPLNQVVDDSQTSEQCDAVRGEPVLSAARPILVVDDNRINQFVVEGLLEDMGLDFECANNGLEALQRIREKEESHRFGLVLMDCQMPEMDGYEATRQIRSGAAGDDKRDTPIIAMTANAMEGDRENCISAGMNDYVTKPLNEKIFEEKIKQWLSYPQEL